MTMVPLTEFATPERNSIVDGPFGSDLKASEYVEAGVPVIRLQNIRPNEFLHKDIKFVADAKALELRRHNYRPGDIVITKLGDPCGVACIVPETAGEGIIVADVVRVRPNLDQVDPRYIVHAWNSPVVRRQIEAQTRGTTRPRVNLSLLKAVQCPKPPLPEQRRIADILDRADALKRKRQEAIKLTDEFLRATFIDMFGDPVANTKNWPITNLSTVAPSRLGKMLDSKKQTGMHLRPYLRNVNVQWHRIDLTDLAEMDFTAEDRAEFALNQNDVLVCEGGEVGRAAIWHGQRPDCYFQKALHRLRPDPNAITAEYLVFLLQLYAEQGAFAKVTSSATIAHLTGEKLRELGVPVPPLDCQRSFVKASEKVRGIKLQMEDSASKLESCNKSVTQLLLSGDKPR